MPLQFRNNKAMQPLTHKIQNVSCGKISVSMLYHFMRFPGKICTEIIIMEQKSTPTLLTEPRETRCRQKTCSKPCEGSLCKSLRVQLKQTAEKVAALFVLWEEESRYPPLALSA